MGFNVVKYFAEDYSAKNFDDRPEFNKLLSFLKANRGLVHKLIVVRWDRFSRNAPESYTMITRLKKIGIEVNAIEQPIDFSVPEQKMMLSFYLTIPEVENDRRAINTTNGMRKNKRQGRWLGTAPTGYKNMRDGQDKPIIVKSDKAPAVKKAFELFATGNYQIETLRKKMCREIEGFKLGRNQFGRMLRNVIYCGQIKLNAYCNEPEEIVQGIHEPIISEELFNEVQQILNGKKRVLAKINKVRKEFPMRGYLVCKCCGGNLTASCSTGRNGKYYYYHCQRGCTERIAVPTGHEAFEKWLGEISLKPDVRRLYLSVMENVFKSNGTDREVEILKLENEIGKNTEMLNKATKKRVNDEMDMDDFQRFKASLTKETADLRTKIAELKDTESGFMEYLRFGTTILGNLKYYYSTATLEGKQKIFGSIFREKLIFSENTYRTAKPNEVLTFLYDVNKDFGKRKAAKNGSLSYRVTPRGIEPRTRRLRVCCSTS